MEHKLYRSRDNRMLGGVCGGLGEYFDIDPTLVRVLLVAVTLLSVGAFVLLYIVLLIVVPLRPFGDEAFDEAEPIETAIPEMQPVVDKVTTIEDQAQQDIEGSE